MDIPASSIEDQVPSFVLDKEKLLLWAEHYTRYGLRLLPLPFRKKAPVMNGWPGRASNDYETVAGWIENGYPRMINDAELLPAGGLGIATGQGSGVIVLDVDGEEGKRTLKALEAKHGTIRQSPMQKTPGGGYHVFFRYFGPCRNRAGMLDKEGHKGLDIRADGGQVVAAPSLHPKTGTAYEWISGAGLDDLEIAECPDWLKAIIEGKPVESKAAPVGEVIAEGARDQTLTSLAGTMRRRGMSEAAIEAALLETNRTQCQPPLSDAQVRKIARSIGTKPAENDCRQEKKPLVAVNKEKLLALRKTLDPDVQLPPVEMVAGLFPKAYLSAIIAGSGVGKTWFVQRVVSDLSVGGPVFDGFAEANPTKSMILAGEAGYELLIRRSHEVRWPVDKDNVVIYSALEGIKEGISFDLGTDEGQKYIDAALDIDVPELLIIDTLTAFHSMDENKADAMKPIFNYLLRTARERNIAIVLAHHTRKRKLSERNFFMTQDETIGSSVFNRLAAVMVGIESIANRGADGSTDLMQSGPPQMKNLVRIQKCWYKNPAPFVYSLTENGCGQTVMNIDLTPKIGGDARSRIWEYIERTYGIDEWFRSADVADATGITDRYARQFLADLVNKNVLQKRGQTKSVEYAIKGSYAKKLEALQNTP